MSRCWAYGPEGRCDSEAGHTGKHSIMVSWDDSECITPDQPSREAAALAFVEATRPVLAPPVAKPEPNRCIACQHQHRGGDCKCGCYEFIG